MFSVHFPKIDNKKASRIYRWWNSCFKKSEKMQRLKNYKSFILNNKKFKVCFNIGSNWGPRLPARRGEHADSVPTFGNGVKSLSLINWSRSKKKEYIQSLKTFSKLITYLKFRYSLFQNSPSHSKIELVLRWLEQSLEAQQIIEHFISHQSK